MAAIYGTVTGGKVEFPVPVGWPDGTKVRVEPAEEQPDVGLSEEDWDTSPEGIAAWIAMVDQLQPLILTPEEEAVFRGERDEQRRFDHAAGDARADALAAGAG
jgi:hypothetical protein